MIIIDHARNNEAIKHFTRPTFQARALAYFFDTVLFWAICFLLPLPFFYFSFAHTVSIFIAFVIFLMRDGNSAGAGYGKKKVSLMVINLKTLKPCNKWKSLLRSILSNISIIVIMLQLQDKEFLPIVFSVVFLTDLALAISGKGRRAGDVAAGTMVVYREEYLSYADHNGITA